MSRLGVLPILNPNHNAAPLLVRFCCEVRWGRGPERESYLRDMQNLFHTILIHQKEEKLLCSEEILMKKEAMVEQE